jgi:hypothetical protein
VPVNVKLRPCSSTGTEIPGSVQEHELYVRFPVAHDYSENSIQPTTFSRAGIDPKPSSGQNLDNT